MGQHDPCLPCRANLVATAFEGKPYSLSTVSTPLLLYILIAYSLIPNLRGCIKLRYIPTIVTSKQLNPACHGPNPWRVRKEATYKQEFAIFKFDEELALEDTRNKHMAPISYITLASSVSSEITPLKPYADIEDRLKVTRGSQDPKSQSIMFLGESEPRYLPE